MCHSKIIKLGLVNPTPINLETILFLKKEELIKIDSVEIIGIFHESQKKLISWTNRFIKERGYENISIFLVKSLVSMDSLFVANKWSSEFSDLFLKTDGLIFLGGADISPSLYGEEIFLTTELIPVERNWEISFLFHLLGGYQNTQFVPFLEQKPNYLILGICLGMQEMNVASGGSLYQDIPFQIYKKKTYESVINQDSEKQHKNYQKEINNWSEKSSILHFHHILVISNSIIDYKLLVKPLILSLHHQAVKKLGKNFKVVATSLDKTVIEAISNSKYKNVYGIQFHPEFSILYKQEKFKNAKGNSVSFSHNDKKFHRLFWDDFSNRLNNQK